MPEVPERDESDDEGFLSDYSTSHMREQIIKARQTGEVYKLSPEQEKEYKSWFPDGDIDSDETEIEEDLVIDEERSAERRPIPLPEKRPDSLERGTHVTVR